MKVFLEEQKMIKPLIIFVLSIAFVGIIISVFNDWNSVTQSNLDKKIIHMSSIIIIVLIALFIFNLKLKTRIDEKGIYYQFYPFHRSYRIILWNDIATCYLRKYNAILDYGGWGFRNGFLKKKGKAFTVKGNIGIQLELKTGKKILLGTQKKGEIESVLENYRYKLT